MSTTDLFREAFAQEARDRAKLKATEQERDTLKAQATSMRDLLMELAPFVAVLSRSELVWPEAREALLKLEPTLLKVLLETKPPEEPLPKFTRELWPDGPGGGPYSAREYALQNEYKQRVREQRERLGLPPYDWSQW